MQSLFCSVYRDNSHHKYFWGSGVSPKLYAGASAEAYPWDPRASVGTRPYVFHGEYIFYSLMEVKSHGAMGESWLGSFVTVMGTPVGSPLAGKQADSIACHVQKGTTKAGTGCQPAELFWPRANADRRGAPG